MSAGNEDRGKGKIEQARGAVKEGFGALTGNRKTEIEGKAERLKGHLREGLGDLKNELTDDGVDSVDHDPNHKR